MKTTYRARHIAETGKNSVGNKEKTATRKGTLHSLADVAQMAGLLDKSNQFTLTVSTPGHDGHRRYSQDGDWGSLR